MKRISVGWSPKDDITTVELAHALPALMMLMTNPEMNAANLLASMSANVRRHFDETLEIPHNG